MLIIILLAVLAIALIAGLGAVVVSRSTAGWVTAGVAAVRSEARRKKAA